jgi:hypothetical protein
MFRAMTERKFWKPLDYTPVGACLQPMEFPIPRSYVLAFSAEGNATIPELFAQRLSNYLSTTGKSVHLHGVWIAGSAFYMTVPVDPETAAEQDWHHVKYTTEHQMAAFKWNLLHDLARFPRMGQNWAPAIDQYGVTTAWKQCTPERRSTE